MPNEMPGREWPDDVGVADQPTRRMRERTRGRIALIIVLAVLVGMGGALLYRAVVGEWGWPVGLLIGLSINWLRDIVRHYFGRVSDAEIDADLF